MKTDETIRLPRLTFSETRQCRQCKRKHPTWKAFREAHQKLARDFYKRAATQRGLDDLCFPSVLLAYTARMIRPDFDVLYHDPQPNYTALDPHHSAFLKAKESADEFADLVATRPELFDAENCIEIQKEHDTERKQRVAASPLKVVASNPSPRQLRRFRLRAGGTGATPLTLVQGSRPAE